MILLPDIHKIECKGTKYLQSDKDYERRAYAMLKKSSFSQYRKNQDVIDFLIYQFKRCDLRFDANKFDSIDRYRNIVVKEFVYKKLIEALKKAKHYAILDKNTKWNDTTEQTQLCLDIVNKAELNTLQSDIIYFHYYLNEPFNKIGKKLQMTTNKVRKTHDEILEKLRKVKYVEN